MTLGETVKYHAKMNITNTMSIFDLFKLEQDPKLIYAMNCYMVALQLIQEYMKMEKKLKEI
jgi:hypothetical protein